MYVTFYVVFRLLTCIHFAGKKCQTLAKISESATANKTFFMLGFTTSAPVKSMVANVNKSGQNYTWEVSYSKCLQSK